MLGGDKEFAHIFDQGTVASEGSSKYNRHFMMDNFQLLIAPASLLVFFIYLSLSDYRTTREPRVDSVPISLSQNDLSEL